MGAIIVPPPQPQKVCRTPFPGSRPPHPTDSHTFESVRVERRTTTVERRQRQRADGGAEDMAEDLDRPEMPRRDFVDHV